VCGQTNVRKAGLCKKRKEGFVIKITQWNQALTCNVRVVRGFGRYERIIRTEQSEGCSASAKQAEQVSHVDIHSQNPYILYLVKNNISNRAEARRIKAFAL
jgi:hypothetical protein